MPGLDPGIHPYATRVATRPRRNGTVDRRVKLGDDDLIICFELEAMSKSELNRLPHPEPVEG
jgi:hypothetical protein